jgi:hypothetical protein
MALRQQAMLRAARFEAGVFSACLHACLESDGSARFPLHEDITYGIEVTLAQNRNYMLADGFFVWPARATAFHCSCATKPRRSACTGARWRNSRG